MDFGTVKRVWVPMAAGAFALGMIYASGPGPRGWARVVGLALAVVGFSGVILSRHTLGKSFSVRAKANVLVTSGIYSKIRNPIYVSGEVCAVGVAIMVWKLYLLVFVLAVIPMQIWRARNESRVLEEKFGDEYREYRERTWF